MTSMISPHLLTANELLKFVWLFAGSAIIALAATWVIIDRFEQWNIVASTNARSMHEKPVPFGGGWAIVPLSLFAWMVLFWPIEDPLTWAIVGATAVLAVLSWIDDRQHLPQLMRLSVQAMAVALVLYLLPDDRSVFSHNWPLWMDRLLTGLCWVWFVNLFNFMDGIDGLAGTQILFICAGFVIVGHAIHFALPLLHGVTVLAGATAGFLWWNWHPAKIFLGDIGAISIGFLLGYLLILLALEGQIVAALLLPAYFISDATITILKRMAKKEPFWEPHKTHFYQRAAMALGSHSKTLWKIIAANAGLLLFAVASPRQPIISMVFGVAIVIFALFALENTSKEK